MMRTDRATTLVVDTHAHLSDPSFDPDREAVLERAGAAGVQAILCVSEDLGDARRVLSLAQRHAMLRPVLGLYPGRVQGGAADELIALIRERRTLIAGIGEVGLDYWLAKDSEAQEAQRAVLDRFVALARECDLPLNVHSRSAGRHAVQFLLDRGARRVQMHAFDGRASAAMAGVEAGYFFSIPPSVVRSAQKQRLVRHLPLTCLLLESDSPVLGPLPGERNEPANVMVAARAVAELKGVPLQELLEVVEASVRGLYGDLRKGQFASLD